MGEEKILVIDDDRLILATLEAGLRRAGYSVVSASSGSAALELCARERSDLAIVDIRLPDMSGIQVARRIRSDFDIPFIFLSAYDDVEIVEQAVDAGALGYLVKPVDVNRMVPSIEAALGRAVELKQLRLAELNLSTALAQGRETSIATGLIMERYRLSKSESFELLRKNARSQRRKVAEIAYEIIRAAESINLPGQSGLPGKATKHRGKADE